MSGHVKVLACILWLEVMGFTLIRYLVIEYLVQVCNKEEKMKTNIKLLKVCLCTVGWKILKLNNHDMIMVSLCKACIDFPE